MAGERKALLVAVWGLPSGWYEASYYPAVPPAEPQRWGRLREWGTSETPVESHSSVLAEAKLLIGMGWSVGFLIYGLDTLASPGGLERTGCTDAAKELERVKVEAAREPPQSYSELVDRAGRVLRAYFNCFKTRTLGGGAQADTEIAVLPGVGSYRVDGVKYVYKGSPLTARTALEYKLYTTLRRYKPSAVILDLSHGVNYLPAIALQALKRCLKAYTAIEGVEVSYAVLNSDPVTSKGGEATIHVIEAGRVKTGLLELLSELASSPALSDNYKVYRMLARTRPPKVVEELNGRHRLLAEGSAPIAKALAKASSYGLALYIALKLRELSERENAEERIKEFREALEHATGLDPSKAGVEVTCLPGGTTVNITWSYLVEPEILDTLYTCEALKEALENYKQLLGRESAWRRAGRAVLVKLETLKELMENLGLSGIGLIFFEKEYHDIDSSVKSYAEKLGGLREPKVYSEVLNVVREGRQAAGGKPSGQSRADGCDIDKRNFYAHAGMERNAILVVLDDKSVYVGYRPECLENVEELLAEG